LQAEGWFDEEGWEPRWFEESGTGRKPRVGGGHRWSLDAWRKARDAWQEHGEQNLLVFRSEAEKANLEALAKRYHERSRVPEGISPPQTRDENLTEAERQEQFAARFLWEQAFYTNVSNFKHFLTRTRVEAREETVKARKLFFEAEELNYAASLDPALEKFEDPAALTAWRDQVLLKNDDFRKDTWIQEYNAELQWKYLQLWNRLHGRALKGRLAKAAACVPLLPKTDPDVDAFRPSIIQGPLDGTDAAGEPIIGAPSSNAALQRLGVLQPKAPPPGAQMPDGRGPPQQRPPQ
jgi:hypothetical protein